MRLPIELCNSPDIFQVKMSELMSGLEFARVYLDDLLFITKGHFYKLLAVWKQALTRISAAGIKLNVSKSSFCQAQLEYLGYCFTHQGIRPVTKKVETIQELKVPTCAS